MHIPTITFQIDQEVVLFLIVMFLYCNNLGDEDEGVRLGLVVLERMSKSLIS